MDALSKQLFDKYKEIHGDHVGRGVSETEWQTQYNYYGDQNYWQYIEPKGKDAAILEIGSYFGHQLKWLSNRGFKNLSGIEVDPGSIATAKKILPDTPFYQEDALSFLNRTDKEFDVVIMKAVLEHIDRDETSPLIEAIFRRLRPGGVFLVVVPNMDWLLANHERYLDATHVMGYTRESLGEVLRLSFPEAKVFPFEMQLLPGAYGRFQKMMRRMSVAILRKMFFYIGDGLDQCWFEHRAIMGVGIKK